MLLKNAEIFNDRFDLVRADLSETDGKIDRIAPELPGSGGLDLTGCIVAPGFVDIHIHGCGGADTCDGTREAIASMAANLVTHGVTSFCPTTMTVSLGRIEKVLGVVKNCMENPPEGASVRGVNMEGPYLSPNRLGAQKKEFVRRPDADEFKRLFDECGGIIRLVDVAPECDGSEKFIRQVSRFCKVSLAHTDADYGQAVQSFGWGITHVTHLFNAMTGLNHRVPGAVGAVFDDRHVKAEMICDGFHVHPAVLRAAFRLLGEDRTVVVSDSMRAADLPDGVSELGGQEVFVKDGQARLADGTIAGSTTNLADELKKLVEFGISPRQAVRSVTINPAREIGADREIGSIEPGKQADLVILDKQFRVLQVIHAGKIVAGGKR